MALPKITESIIRAGATPQSFQRGDEAGIREVTCTCPHEYATNDAFMTYSDVNR
jgi:hypothetical protein